MKSRSRPSFGVLGWVGLGLLAPACHAVAPASDAGIDAAMMDGGNDVATSTDTVVMATNGLRAIAPLSTEIVTSRRPTFHWLVPDGTAGVVAEICADRNCGTVEFTLPSTATAAGPASAVPPSDLPAGVHFWRVRSGALSTPAFEIVVGHGTATAHDGRVGEITDLNGDGLADIVVGASHAMTEAGHVYVYNGAAHGVVAMPSATLVGTGELAGHFGWWVAPAGDVNGDGYGDLVVSAPDVSSGTGTVSIFLGSSTGVPTRASITLAAPDPSGNFGAFASSAGDVNGDGYADIVVGAPNVASSAGRVYVFLGGPSGTQSTPSVTLDGTDGVGGTFGSAVAGVGDVNGDGYADIVAGASGADSTIGRAYLYLGSMNGIVTTPSVTIQAPTMDSGQFGASISGAGDVNGDGLADVLIGASGTVSGDSWVYAGTTRGGLSATPTTPLPSPDGERGGFGWAVSSAGDVNGDGFGDIIVSAVCAPFHPDPDGGYPTCGAGVIHVYNGTATGVSTTASATIEGPPGEPASFGWAVANAGDVDGDGFDDIIVGAEGTNMFGGSAYVYRGAASGLVSTPMVELDGPDGTGGNFGWSVALRSAAARPWSGI